MSDHETPSVSEGTVRPASEDLNREAIEQVLGNFQTWLEQAAHAAEGPSEGESATQERIDLYKLLAEFTSLRHEVNLQTKASRKQQEQSDSTLQQLTQTVAMLQQQQETLAEQTQAQIEESARPFLKALVDVYDALTLARREVQRVDDALLPALAELEAMAERSSARQVEVSPVQRTEEMPEYSLWSRLFGRPKIPVVVKETGPDIAPHLQENVQRIRRLVASIATGYSMSVQRLERTLVQFELQPIPAVGEPFDPELMEAIEVIVESGRTATEVVEEVRRGYMWKGRVFRFAQVKVAKPDLRENNHE